MYRKVSVGSSLEKWNHASQVQFENHIGGISGIRNCLHLMLSRIARVSDLPHVSDPITYVQVYKHSASDSDPLRPQCQEVLGKCIVWNISAEDGLFPSLSQCLTVHRCVGHG